ncbi:hypothetical protein ACFXGA_07015 [Actinosynnema sp. NPDC059335]|uniref:hypothetical protein n=1 Tax=Actinosynnema sp. NPDC059335 TaxID=3346804 RepID=UPI00366CFD88
MSHIEEQAKSRRRFAERLASTLALTAVMAWATVVIVFVSDVDGVVAAAVSVALAGGLVAVYDAWREVRTARPVRGEPDVEVAEELVRL